MNTLVRARIDLIPRLIKQYQDREDYLVLLRNGVIPLLLSESDLLQEHRSKKNYPRHELSFLEICTFNSWFYMHPDKVCGKEYATTSKAFPVSVKGTKEDIIQTIQKGMNPNESYMQNELEFEALALEIELELVKL